MDINLGVGGQPGPLKKWKVDLPDTFDIIEYDWSDRLIKSDDIETLPIVGAFLINQSHTAEDENIIRPYFWGKKGHPLRSIPKLVVIAPSNLGEGDFAAIKDALEEQLINLDVLVIIADPAELIIGSSTDAVQVSLESEFTESIIKTPPDDDDEFNDYDSTVTAGVFGVLYDHTKWDGYEVLAIEASLSYVKFFDIPTSQSGGLPPRGESTITETVSMASAQPNYVLYDSNPIWTEDHEGVAHVSDVETKVSVITEQVALAKTGYQELYHPDMYKRVALKHIHAVVKRPITYNTTYLSDSRDDSGIWVSKFTDLQDQVLNLSATKTEEIITSVSGTYSRLDFTSFEAHEAGNEERVQLIVDWIKEFFEL